MAKTTVGRALGGLMVAQPQRVLGREGGFSAARSALYRYQQVSRVEIDGTAKRRWRSRRRTIGSSDCAACMPQARVCSAAHSHAAPSNGTKRFDEASMPPMRRHEPLG